MLLLCVCSSCFCSLNCLFFCCACSYVPLPSEFLQFVTVDAFCTRSCSLWPACVLFIVWGMDAWSSLETETETHR